MKMPSKKKALMEVGKDLTCLWDMWMSGLVWSMMMVKENA
jgi:hypothetical protein